ncbi:MAG: Gfo/Idh/MocA family protein, partial [Pirellulales bacterium]
MNQSAVQTAHLPKLPQDLSRPIGCIGSGFIMANCHLPAYRQAGFNPIAIASRTRANAEAVADRHNLTAYDSYLSMLCDADIQVVDVAVPPHMQLAVIRDIVKYTPKIKGILAQKPLGVDYQQAREIVDLCAQADIVLSVNQNMRYDQSVRTCKHLLNEGLLGEPV